MACLACNHRQREALEEDLAKSETPNWRALRHAYGIHHLALMRHKREHMKRYNSGLQILRQNHCTICRHSELAAIEVHLRHGANVSHLARIYQVNPRILMGHIEHSDPAVELQENQLQANRDIHLLISEERLLEDRVCAQLDNHGVDYQRQVPCAYGILDILTMTDPQVIIEVKGDITSASIHRAIGQLICYGYEYPGARRYLSTPYLIDEKIGKVLRSCEIDVWPIMCDACDGFSWREVANIDYYRMNKVQKSTEKLFQAAWESMDEAHRQQTLAWLKQLLASNGGPRELSYL